MQILSNFMKSHIKYNYNRSINLSTLGMKGGHILYTRFSVSSPGFMVSFSGIVFSGNFARLYISLSSISHNEN